MSEFLTFTFEGRRYAVSSAVGSGNNVIIRLPDRRTIEVRTWTNTLPPQPKDLAVIRSLDGRPAYDAAFADEQVWQLAPKAVVLGIQLFSSDGRLSAVIRPSNPDFRIGQPLPRFVYGDVVEIRVEGKLLTTFTLTYVRWDVWAETLTFAAHSLERRS